MGLRVAPKKLNGRPKRKNSELGNIYIYEEKERPRRK